MQGIGRKRDNMKATVKGLVFEVTMNAAFKGSLDEIPSQSQEMAETHLKDSDISGSVSLKVGIDESTTDITPDEMKDLIKAVTDVAREQLEGNLHKQSMRLERDRMDLEREKASFAAKNFKNE